MSEHWELDPASKKGVWSFRAHKPNYFLVGRYTDSVNMEPYDVFFNAVGDPSLGIDEVEAKFQLSFKVKALEGLFGSDADLWVGYTQQSHWQVYNDGISAPFRESDYEPEVFVTLPTRYDLLGLRGRFVNLGFVHQSNGQSNILSRSWNRVYAQFGFEYGDRFNLLFKPWYRIEEDAADDDNPDITDYVGDFEMVASYKLGQHTLSALARSNFSFERGFLQLDWAFPLYQNLKGYVQATTGYGESLIDYNHSQNTIGMGILLTNWM
jgi:phospholipase A1